MTALEVVREVGSLGALLFVVFWFTRSMDRRDEALVETVEALRRAVASFNAFEDEEKKIHTAIRDDLKAQTLLLQQLAEKWPA